VCGGESGTKNGDFGQKIKERFKKKDLMYRYGTG
jgi:hypothetical protein